MEQYKITDGTVTVTVNSKGAEVASAVRDGKEYMWNADPKFWGRTAPVLFPVVGSFKNKEYRYDGNTYKMGQHGFARDMEFELVSHDGDSLVMSLRDNEETFKVYPFHFELIISYSVYGGMLTVDWTVINDGIDDMYFSVGGHPAFMCPVGGGSLAKDYSLKIMKGGKPVEKLVSTPLTGEGTASADKHNEYELKDGVLPVSTELFADDALVIENAQTDSISLLDSEGYDYLTVDFKTPLVGLWTPAGKDAPFVCIEPWYGRCDRENFDGELKDREWGNMLEPGEKFNGGFTVKFR